MDIQQEWWNRRMRALQAIEAAGLDTHPDVLSWLEILPDRDSFFNNLTDTIPFLVYIYDLEKSTFIYFNRQFIEFTGYSREELYSMGTDGFAIICHHEDMPNLLAFRREIEDAKDDEVLKLGYRIVCKSGEAFWLHSQIKIIARNKSGEVSQFMGVSQDISQIKEIEDLLIRQENLYSSVLEYIPTDIAVLDIEGKYRYVNPSGKRDPEIRKWMLGKSDADLFAHRGRDEKLSLQRIEAFRTTIETKKSIQFEDEWPLPDSSIKSTLRSYFPVLDAQQNILMVIGYGMDISDRRNSERKMMQRELKYKYLVEHGTDVFLQMDTDGSINHSNLPANELSGYSSDLLTQMNMLDLVRVDYREKVKAAFASLSQQAIYLEFPIKTRDGSEKWIGQNLQQYTDEDGQLVIQSLARDITDNKQVLVQLEDKKLRLEEAFQIGKIGSFDLFFD
ncbi:MAG: PAS domain S-box protein, partial [Saprospiraceae bacterium]